MTPDRRNAPPVSASCTSSEIALGNVAASSIPIPAPAVLHATSNRLHKRETSNSCAISMDADSRAAASTVAIERRTGDRDSFIDRKQNAPKGTYRTRLTTASRPAKRSKTVGQE